MLFCLDVGNSQTYGGVYEGNELQFTFRRTSSAGASSDESGIFFRTVLRENGVDPAAVKRVAICSVVPEAVHSLRNCFWKYFQVEPFLLREGFIQRTPRGRMITAKAMAHLGISQKQNPKPPRSGSESADQRELFD